MFCPNCGTSNEDSAPRCKQCGFELQQAKPAAPKFKGTMLLGKSPFAPGGAPAPGSPGAPDQPGGDAAAAPPAAGAPRPGASRAGLKGTMVGVAPPAVGSAAPPPGTAASTGAPPAGTPGAPGGQQSRPAAMKGTMLGLAPPGFGAPGSPAAGPGLGGGLGQPPAGQTPATQVSSKLKGTMIGVAPPSFGGAPPAGAPMDATIALPSQAPQVQGKLPPTQAMPAVGASDSINPLGGTVMGNPAPDFSAHANAGFDRTALGQPPMASLPAEPQQAASGGDSYGLGALAATNPAGSGFPGESAQQVSAATVEPAAPFQQISPSYAQPMVASGARGPVGKVRNPVATLLVGMLCFVYALVAYIQMLGELKTFRQKGDLSLLLFFIPIINIIEVLKLPEKVADAQRMAGVQNPQVAHPVLYLFFGLYFLPADLNEVWEAARRNG